MTGWGAIDPRWRACFELAWQAHLEGSNPIGALVTDAAGQIVATGKSAVRGQVTDVVVAHREIAHAEVNALLALDNRVHVAVNDYVLYVTLEPCPVCFGAFYMSGVRNLRYAAKDAFGGSTNLFGTTPYLSRKPMVMEGPVAGLDRLSIFLNVYSDVSMRRDSGTIHQAFATDYPDAVALGAKLGVDVRLYINQLVDFYQVYDRISRAFGDGD